MTFFVIFALIEYACFVLFEKNWRSRTLQKNQDAKRPRQKEGEGKRREGREGV